MSPTLSWATKDESQGNVYYRLSFQAREDGALLYTAGAGPQGWGVIELLTAEAGCGMGTRVELVSTAGPDVRCLLSAPVM